MSMKTVSDKVMQQEDHLNQQLLHGRVEHWYVSPQTTFSIHCKHARNQGASCKIFHQPWKDVLGAVETIGHSLKI